MSAFGQTLFGGSRSIRWALSPFVLLFAVTMPLLVEEWTLKLVVMIGGMEFLCVALLAGFWLPGRIGRLGFRFAGGSVFAAYAAYLFYEFFFSETPFKLFESHGEASPRNALLGFVIIGLPSLWYAVFGRFALREPQPEPETMESENDAT